MKSCNGGNNSFKINYTTSHYFEEKFPPRCAANLDFNISRYVFVFNSHDVKKLTHLTVCAKLLGSSYGQLQVSTSYNTNELCELISVKQRLMQYLR